MTNRTMRDVRRVLVLAVFLGICQVSSWAQSPIFYGTVNGRPIGLRAPPGFVDPRVARPDLKIKVADFPGNRNLAYLISLADLPVLEKAGAGAISRSIRIESFLALAGNELSEEDFRKEKGKIRSETLDPNIKNLGIVDETKHSISRMTLGNHNPQTGAYGSLVVFSAVNVKGALIGVLVLSKPRSDGDVNWAQEVTKAMVREILQANQVKVLSP